MGLFGDAGIDLNKSAAPTGGGYYFTTGNYEIEVTAVKSIKTRKNRKMFVLETIILESDNPDRAVGSRPSWTQYLDENWAGEYLSILFAALSGLSTKNPSDTAAIKKQDLNGFAEQACSDENPLAGSRLRVEVVKRQLKTPKTNQDGSVRTMFDKVDFYPTKKPTSFQEKLLAKARAAVAVAK